MSSLYMHVILDGLIYIVIQYKKNLALHSSFHRKKNDGNDSHIIAYIKKHFSKWSQLFKNILIKIKYNKTRQWIS